MFKKLKINSRFQLLKDKTTLFGKLSLYKEQISQMVNDVYNTNAMSSMRNASLSHTGNQGHLITRPTRALYTSGEGCRMVLLELCLQLPLQTMDLLLDLGRRQVFLRHYSIRPQTRLNSISREICTENVSNSYLVRNK